ncbi:MAG: hypothetical protein RKR03_08055 [Candidatus Competibacter sp.]|nr:hypothetical protein [Candidatus Competibacter sp.]
MPTLAAVPALYALVKKAILRRAARFSGRRSEVADAMGGPTS